MAPSVLPPPRAVLAAVFPEIDGGRFPAKSSLGERFEVTAHAFTDGHDRLAVRLLHRPADGEWSEVPMRDLGNDEWRADVAPASIGMHEYTVVAWIDRFATWRADLEKRVAAGWDVTSELQEGAALLNAAAERAAGEDRMALLAAGTWLLDADMAQARRVEVALGDELPALMTAYRDRALDVAYERVLSLWVDRERARFGSWYEMFPRSETPDPGRSATFHEAAGRLPAIAAMGFDVLYLPPIHPIGESHRKGRNNAVTAAPGDLGSPWAIGSADGGHTAVHPGLGTIEDFEALVAEAGRHGLEVALDLAYQCSPDHPWVREHSQWFRHRPDGTIKYAENPPKQYQDIYPFDFETEDWQALWRALHEVVEFWIGHGVRIFRVDNPHTKPFPFWEWLIRTVHESRPDVIFLAEAFTTPKRMQGLAKRGFTQSYTYFTWRNTKRELTEYLTELTTAPVRDYLRGNLFVNTPDILHEYLQRGGRPAFLVRAALAATLGPSWGMYSGYELLEATPVHEGAEEYLDSEKYQVRPRDWNAPHSIAEDIARLNRIRREQRALQFNHDLWFLPIENEQLLAYMKSAPDGTGHVLTVVNLDVHAPQSGWVGLPLGAMGIEAGARFSATELLTGRRFTWAGEWNRVALDPSAPVQVYAFTPDAPGSGPEAVYP